MKKKINERAQLPLVPPCARDRRRCHDAERKQPGSRGDELEKNVAKVTCSYLKTRLCVVLVVLFNVAAQSDTSRSVWLEFYAVKVVLNTGFMKAHGSAIKVFARIRPTANLARGLIECLPDGEVTKTSWIKAEWSYRNLTSKSRTYEKCMVVDVEVENDSLN